MIKLVRADERLIHGQTMQFIVTDYSIRRIVVVDDMTANNPLLKSIFQTAVPKEIKASVHTIADSKDAIEEILNNDESALLLIKHPRVYLPLREMIPNLPNSLNIGSQMAKKGVRYAEYASLGEEDIAACETLTEQGVRVYFNAIGASGSVVEWKSVHK